MSAGTILLIEDDPALLRGLKDNFEAQGYHVRTANDGQRGLYALLSDPPDFLLLDLMLPRLSGYDICKAARSHHLDMPIMVLTARSEEADVLRGLKCGADDYVTKPFDIDDVIARARALSWLDACRRARTNPDARWHSAARDSDHPTWDSQ